MRLRSANLILLLMLLASACAPVQPSTAAGASAGAATPLPPNSGTTVAALATIVAKTLSAPTARPVLPSATAAAPAGPPTRTPAAAAPAGEPDPAVLSARTQYKLDVDFSYNARSGTVREEIHYTNRSGDEIPDLLLMVELFSYQQAFSLTGMWWQDGQKIENASRENAQIRVPLPSPLQPGQSVGLKLTYEFRLPSQSEVAGERPIPIGYTSRQANLVDWYPFIPPYRSGHGWLAHPPAYYGEHLVFDLADFEINLRLTDEREDLIVAASAAQEQDGDVLRFRREGARNFALSIGHEYATKTEEVDGITITSYYFPLNFKAGQRVLQTTVEAVKLFQEMFGPYPHDTLAVVEADFYDGMEYDGLYFLSRAFYNIHTDKPDDYLVAIAAHETAHQWWYGIVANDQANEPWLDEALATYSELLYYERYYPEAIEWWWYYRIDYYRPHGWVDTSVYNPQGTLQTYQDYRNAVYLNGAHFFHDLREATGEDVFLEFLKDYTSQYGGHIALSEDFFALLAQHSTVDLQPVKAKYFANP